MRLHLALALAATLYAAQGCTPEIGDSCSSSLDCSANNTRICDTSSRKGYCTIKSCDPNGCPNRALCVEWRGDEPRTADTWCMQRCNKDSDCRSRYTCVHEGDDVVMDGDTPIARVIDLDSRRERGFCAYVEE